MTYADLPQGAVAISDSAKIDLLLSKTQHFVMFTAHDDDERKYYVDRVSAILPLLFEITQKQKEMINDLSQKLKAAELEIKDRLSGGKMHAKENQELQAQMRALAGEVARLRGVIKEARHNLTAGLITE